MGGMARKKKNGEKRRERERGAREDAGMHLNLAVHPEVKKTVLAIVFFVAALVFALSFVGKGGTAGAQLFRVLDFLLGRGYFFAPLTCLLAGFSLLFSETPKLVRATMLGALLFLLSCLSLLPIVFGPGTGGVLGGLIGAPLLKLFDFWVSLIIVLALLVISLLLTLNVPFWKELFVRGEGEEDEEEEPAVVGAAEAAAMGVKGVMDTIKSALEKNQPAAEMPATVLAAKEKDDEATIAVRRVAKKFDYKKPPLELLQSDRGKPTSGDIRANANIIKRTLENFGINVEMDEVSIGPTLTQYTLKPAEGVKLARITALGNDLSLALAAHPIRIEAPIPGKSLVGIEVPNRSIAMVGLRTLLEYPAFIDATQPLLITLGRDVTGTPVFADLAKMPHLLVSGATGSGKSVTIHSIITSLLYRNPPEMLRFIMVDPKRVELSVYNDIPHLLTPVITDPKTTIQALKWATKEMDRRYGLLSTKRCRDIAGYNAIASKASDEEIIPYIVVMIDELADLMMTFPREMESSIIRLAQMARAVGIHLLVATQRPSVDVITGLIKANITSRIALQVSSQIDSRTILDMAGAEKLLGNGDMLFLAGDTSKPRRIQGAYVSEQEVKRVVDFLREESEAVEYKEEILTTKVEDENKGATGLDDLNEDDPLYQEAEALIRDAGKASASYLQRRLRVGYARAARILDLLESNGVIGPADGAKPREVLARTADMRENDLI